MEPGFLILEVHHLVDHDIHAEDSIRSIYHTLDHHLPVLILARLCDVESLERISEVECMGEQWFEIDQTTRHEIDG